MISNFLAVLTENGIKVKPDLTKATQEIQTDCPQSYCQKSRPPSNKTPLNVTIDQPHQYTEWRCSFCLWSGHAGEKPDTAEAAHEDDTPIAAPHAPKSLPPDALAFLAAKGLTEEDAIKHKLSWDGTKKAIKIPYFEGTQIVNYALVQIATGKSKLENPNKATFFGLDKLGVNSEPVVIAHRELDAIVLMERGIMNVIGVPNGADIKPTGDDFNQAPDRFAFMSHASAKAKGWHKIVFACDDTKDGLALRQELARRLGPGRCAAAKLTSGSVCQTMAEHGGDWVCTDIREAKDLPILGLFSVDDFENELEAYFNYGMASGVSTGWKNVDKLYTVMPGQFTVVTGIPNSGKSEWLDALSVNLALNENWRFAVFSPENGKEAQTTKLIEKRVEMPADPKAYRRMSIDTFKSGAAWVNNHYTFIESKDAMPTLDWILERAKDAVMRFGAKGLIIDPWNLIEKVLAGKSETDYVAESLPKIRRFAANYGVHVWLVVHPKQQQKNQKTGKIDAPSLYDMAGSAHFVNMCDNGIVVHRSDALDDTSEILINKVRFKHVGRRGSTKLRYDTSSGRYSPIEEELSAQQIAAADRLKSASNGDDDAIRTYEVE
jgi:twinkle protein